MINAKKNAEKRKERKIVMNTKKNAEKRKERNLVRNMKKIKIESKSKVREKTNQKNGGSVKTILIGASFSNRLIVFGCAK